MTTTYVKSKDDFTKVKVKPYGIHGILTTTFDDDVEVEELIFYSAEKNRAFFKYPRRDFSRFDCCMGRCLRFPCNAKGEVFSDRYNIEGERYMRKYDMPPGMKLKDVNAEFLMKGMD